MQGPRKPVPAVLRSGTVTATTPPAIRDITRSIRDHAQGAAVLFDIDGVLAPIVPNAADAQVPPPVLALLGRLRDAYLLAGVISGRGMDDVDRLVPVPGLARGGNHGLEMAEPGAPAHLVPDATEPVKVLREFVDDLGPDVLAPHGAWMEDKGASVSLHYREAPDPGGAGEWLRATVRPAAIAAGLRAREGKMVLEILPDVDVHKGTALRALVRAAGARRVLYVGDDHTDADAWRSMRVMQDTGMIDRAHCVVADGPDVHPAVRAHADAAVAGPGGVVSLMRDLLP